MTDGSTTVCRVLASLAWEMGETAIKSCHAMQYIGANKNVVLNSLTVSSKSLILTPSQGTFYIYTSTTAKCITGLDQIKHGVRLQLTS